MQFILLSCEIHHCTIGLSFIKQFFQALNTYRINLRTSVGKKEDTCFVFPVGIFFNLQTHLTSASGNATPRNHKTRGGSSTLKTTS